LKYGSDLAHSTIRCYEDRSRSVVQQWLVMLKDDNLKGRSMPTIERSSWKILFKEKNDESFHRCLLSRVCLDRAAGHILVYFYARGEANLKYPLLSCIITTLEGINYRIGYQAMRLAIFLEKRTRGHYKGIRTFPQLQFIANPAGKFYFCYANSSVYKGDFEPIELFEIDNDHNQGFCASFSELEGFKYSSKELHPYINDGDDDVDVKRWEAHMPQSAIDRHTEIEIGKDLSLYKQFSRSNIT
jgi:hypothetical protein